MKDFDRMYARWREFGGIRLVREYAKMGVLWVGVKEIVRCILHGKSLKTVYPVVTKRVDERLITRYANPSQSLPSGERLNLDATLSQGIYTADFSQKDNTQDDTPSLRGEEGKVLGPFIWFCWLQGMDEAPELVRICLEDLRRYVEAEVIVIDDKNYGEYVTLPAYITEKYRRGVIPSAMFSDMLRLQLLIQHGGTWIDSTVWTSSRVGEEGSKCWHIWQEIRESELFVYRYFNRQGRVVGMSNWFIHAKAGNKLLSEVRDKLFAYWRDYDCVVEYYMFHIFFDIAANHHREMLQRMPRVNSYPALWLRDHVAQPIDDDKWETLISNVPFHKLNYRKKPYGGTYKKALRQASPFFELLQVAIGRRSSLSRRLTDDEWESVYEQSKRQSVAGIAFAALGRLPKDQLPPGKRIRQWAVRADKIREHSEKVSKECAGVYDFFERNGFDAVILKGQGNYAYYPEWLQGLRSVGDIDVWVRPNGNSLSPVLPRREGALKLQTFETLKHPVRAVIEFCLGKKKGKYVYYHNMDFPILKETPIEVHYRPTWLYNPLRNRSLQCWFKEKDIASFPLYDGYRIPSAEFNVVFQLLHLYKHIFEEGIGMRQLMDYYFVLTSYEAERKSTRNLERDDNGSLNDEMWMISKLRLEGFVGAVMYVMQQVFAMPGEYMLCKQDEKRGAELLDEIIRGGNFGKFDDRYNWKHVTTGSMEYRGVRYAVMRLRHNAIFLASYPSEVLFEPLFRVYHWFWRRLKLWKFQ